MRALAEEFAEAADLRVHQMRLEAAVRRPRPTESSSESSLATSPAPAAPGAASSPSAACEQAAQSPRVVDHKAAFLDLPRGLKQLDAGLLDIYTFNCT